MRIEMTPVGVVHSPFTQAQGTPVQSFVSWYAEGGWPGGDADLAEAPHVDPRGGRGSLEIAEQWREGLRDLAGFTHLWALFWIDRAIEAKPTVVPYRDTVERGIFSTRSPARPNPIGLSCLRIAGISGRFVHVTGLDILDGTPLLDIKPYVPDYDSYREAGRGWLEGPSAIQSTIRADGRFYRE